MKIRKVSVRLQLCHVNSHIVHGMRPINKERYTFLLKKFNQRIDRYHKSSR